MLPPDLVVKAAEQLSRKDVTVINLDGEFCDDTWCYPVVRNLVAYRDYSHITPEYAKALMPWVTKQIENLDVK